MHKSKYRSFIRLNVNFDVCQDEHHKDREQEKCEDAEGRGAKLDGLYQQTVKEAEEQDEKCARELESLEKHKHLLESTVNEDLSEAMDELEAVQQEYQLVLQSITEERGKVRHDLLHLLEMVATHVGSLEQTLRRAN